MKAVIRGMDMRAWMQLFYKKLNWRFLISYIIVFSIPFLILSVILTWLIVSKTKEKIEATNSEGLTQIFLGLEEHFKKLNNITLDMSINSSVGKRVTMTPIEAMAFERELQRYVFFSDIVEDIYVSYNDNEKMYTNVGTLDIDTLISQRHKEEQIDEQLFKQQLVSEAPKLISFAKEEPKTLYYFVPFIFNGAKIGKIVYAIPTAKLMDRIVTPFQKEYQNYLLYLNQEEVSSTLASPGVKKGDMDNYFIQSKVLSGVDLTIYSLVSESVLSHEIEKVLLIVFGSLLILLLIGFGIIVYYGYRQYEPVYRLNRLYQYVAEYSNADIHDVHFDEVGDFLFQQSMMVDSTKKEIQHIRDETFWKHILKGDFTDLYSIEREVKMIGKQFTFDESYLLGLVCADFSKEAETDIQMKSLLINLFPLVKKNYQVECIEMTYLNQFLFIFQLKDQAISNETLTKMKNEFSHYLTKELNSELMLTFSETISTIDKLHFSYISVMAQKERSNQAQKTSDLKTAVFAYPEQMVMTLKQAIKVGNSHAIEQIIRDIVANEQGMPISIFLRQSYYHYVLQQLLLMREEPTILNSFSYRNAAIDLSKIEVEMKYLALELSRTFAEELKAHEKEIDQEIVQMIHDNFTRPSFSLEEMAIKFGVSLSKMSIMVKNEANVSFSKYVQALRIERVKQELLETSKPVKDIIVDVGYHDIANFTRKFREEVGVPPGQFRKIFEKKNNRWEVSN